MKREHFFGLPYPCLAAVETNVDARDATATARKSKATNCIGNGSRHVARVRVENDRLYTQLLDGRGDIPHGTDVAPVHLGQEKLVVVTLVKASRLFTLNSDTNDGTRLAKT